MNQRAKGRGKDGRKAPLGLAGAISTSHSFNCDHFEQYARTGGASLGGLIGSSRKIDPASQRNADRLHRNPHPQRTLRVTRRLAQVEGLV
jgi:hypothetical protein